MGFGVILSGFAKINKERCAIFHAKDWVSTKVVVKFVIHFYLVHQADEYSSAKVDNKFIQGFMWLSDDEAKLEGMIADRNTLSLKRNEP